MRSEAKGLFGLGLWAAIGLGVLACQEFSKDSARQALPEKEAAAGRRSLKDAAGPSLQAEDVTSEHHKLPRLPRTRLSLEGRFSRQAEVFEVEIAGTPESITRGLMWRKSLGSREGMLFVFGQEREQVFWMKNTLVGLDLVFISGEQKVLGTIERATPLSLNSLSIGHPSLYVLEIPAGTCARLGIGIGSKVSWEAW
ncbi:MAG: DUF192 domain-containing protein [Cystobacterineae bacterium]|nr:DUF192 domain-containing protein [Cystobacterineae bacterium]